MADSEKSANLNEQAKAEFQRLTAGKHADCYLQEYCSALDSVLPRAAWAFYYCDGSIEVFVIDGRSVENIIDLVEYAAKLLDDEESLLTVGDGDVFR